MDKHIYASQKLIRKDFPDIIRQTCFLSEDRGYQLVQNLKQNKVIQIHNNGSLHWLVSTSNEDKNIFLYDSLYTTFSQEVLKQTDQIYSMVALNKNVTQKQEGALDCELFAIAYSVDICHNVDPSTVVYDQSKMHKHLAECFKKRKLTQFPCISEGPSYAKPTRPVKEWEWKLPRKIFGERKTRK